MLVYQRVPPNLLLVATFLSFLGILDLDGFGGILIFRKLLF